MVTVTTRQPLPKRLLLGLPAATFAVMAAGWIGGFVWFLSTTRHPAETPPPHADGIVAFTGGAGRVELALHLLASGRANRLLLSGVGGGTELSTLGRLAGIDTAPLANRITLGRYAASTHGNGVETAAWADRNSVGSLIVVTAAYHMPRALSALRQALPDVLLFPLPVLPGRSSPASDPAAPSGDHGAVENRPGLRLEAEEYTKYLLTASGLSAWLPHREPAFQSNHPTSARE